MPTTFMQMVDDAMKAVSGITPDELQRQLADAPETIILDVRDEASIRATGTVPGAIAISAGSLLYKADHEVPEAWRDARLADRDRPIVTHCDLGPLSAIAARNLHELGFTNVRYLAGGIQAWRDSGRSVEAHTSDAE